MNLSNVSIRKLNPWNWFRHEEAENSVGSQIPVQQGGGYTTPAVGNSYSPLADFHREFDRLFDSAFRSFGFPSLFAGNPLVNESFFRPQVDIAGNEKNYEITLDVPGMTQENLSIEVQGDSLIVRGEKQESSENKDKQFYRVERSYGTFQRTLALPNDANAEEIRANLKDGVLALTIPRKPVEGKEVKRIAIN